MEGGVFLLLLVLALSIGLKVGNNRGKPLSAKAQKQRVKMKRVLMWAVCILLAFLWIIYFPAALTELRIALDTRFSAELILLLLILVVALFTLILLLKELLQKKKQ